MICSNFWCLKDNHGPTLSVCINIRIIISAGRRAGLARWVVTDRVLVEDAPHQQTAAGRGQRQRRGHRAVSAVQAGCQSRETMSKLRWGVFCSNLIGHVNEYPIMHYLGIPSHTQSMIAFKILAGSFWKFRWKMHCGNVVNMRFYGVFRYDSSTLGLCLIHTHFILSQHHVFCEVCSHCSCKLSMYYSKVMTCTHQWIKPWA